MSDILPIDGHDELMRIARLAIARAKSRGSNHVTPDDLLAAVLQAVSRFGIVLIGPLTIDLEMLGEERLDEIEAAGKKVAYSAEAAAIFDRAAAVARHDGSHKMAPVHMLAAFAEENDGLMGTLKTAYGFDSAGWRAALVRWQREEEDHRRNGGNTRPASTIQELLSPDDAADLLGVHTQTVRGYIRSGKLTAHRLAGERAVRIKRQDVLDLLEPYDPN